MLVERVEANRKPSKKKVRLAAVRRIDLAGTASLSAAVAALASSTLQPRLSSYPWVFGVQMVVVVGIWWRFRRHPPPAMVHQMRLHAKREGLAIPSGSMIALSIPLGALIGHLVYRYLA